LPSKEIDHSRIAWAVVGALAFDGDELPVDLDDPRERRAAEVLAWWLAADWPGPSERTMRIVRNRHRRAKRTGAARSPRGRPRDRDVELDAALVHVVGLAPSEVVDLKVALGLQRSPTGQPLERARDRVWQRAKLRRPQAKVRQNSPDRQEMTGINRESGPPARRPIPAVESDV